MFNTVFGQFMQTSAIRHLIIYMTLTFKLLLYPASETGWVYRSVFSLWLQIRFGKILLSASTLAMRSQGRKTTHVAA